MSNLHENRTTLRKLVVVSFVMFGFGFAMVPFYKKFCEVTGINNVGKPTRYRTRRSTPGGG